MKKRLLSIIAAVTTLLTCYPLNTYADDMADGQAEEFVEIPDIPEGDRAVLFASDFEDKLLGKWNVFGGAGNISIEESVAHNGSACLKITDRAQSFNGPSVNCDGFFFPGQVYYIDAWVYHDTGDEKAISWTIKYVDGTGLTQFMNLVTLDVPTNEWMQMSTKIQIPDDASSIDWYFECSNATAEFMLDDILVTGLSRDDDGDEDKENSKKGIVKIFDFEDGKEGWNTRGDERLVHTDECSYTGKYSIYSSGRTNTWNGPSVPVNELLEREKEYFFSAYVLYNGKEYEQSHTFLYQIEYTLEGAVQYMLITSKVIEKGKWTEINGYYTLPEGAENVRIYLQTDNVENGPQTDNDLMSFYVDNVAIYDGAVIRRMALVKKIVTVIIILIVLAIIGVIAFFAYKNMKKNKMALEAAEKDAMTHAFNRNTYEKKLEALKADPGHCKTLYFALCDVNFLKYINDNFGHKCGDDAIIRCAKMLVETIGGDGEVYRTGGDEFVVISHKPVKDKITQATAAESTKEGEYPFAVAAGFASYDTSLDGETPDVTKIIARCDKEMYEHKQQIKAENKEFSRK